jgi:hypothetical protein
MIGWKPKYSDPSVASVRLRCLLPMKALQDKGFQIQLFQRHHAYSTVIYSKRYGPADFCEAAALRQAGTKIIFDLCDNHFHTHPWNSETRYWLMSMLTLANHVVVSTQQLYEEVTAHKPGLSSLHVIGDPVEENLDAELTPWWSRWWHEQKYQQLKTEVYDFPKRRAALVWFGIHGTPGQECGMSDLSRIRDVLHNVNRDFPMSLTCISNHQSKFRNLTRDWKIPCHYLPWAAWTFQRALRLHDICVLPISHNPFTRCKSNNRLVTALSHGLGVVADSIPSYEHFRGVTQLDQWDAGLRFYLKDPPLNVAHDVVKGLELIEECYSLPIIAEQWAQLLRGA